MEISFYDRLSKELTTLNEAGFCPGRWIMSDFPEEGPFYLNSVQLISGDFLVKDPRGHWCITYNDSVLAQGTVQRHFIIDEVDAESLREMEKHLGEAYAVGKTWDDWVKISPLAYEEMNRLFQVLSPESLEKTVQKEFGYLESVCMNSMAHLKLETEKIPVSRARRMSTRAVPYLAAHTEDWERLLVQTVRPKRIICEVLEDQVDIYENRATVRLVDHLAFYVTRLIHKMGRLYKAISDKTNYSGAVNGTYNRMERISTLWANIIESEEKYEQVGKIIKELQRLKSRLMGLMDSPLYKSIPRGADVPPTLKNTNIFVNDPNYRRVAFLWRKWRKLGFVSPKKPQENFDEEQAICEGMSYFAMLLVLRSLCLLGYSPVNESKNNIVKKLVKWKLIREGESEDGETIVLEWQPDGSISIVSGTDSLDLLSLPVDFRKCQSGEHLKAFIDEAVDASQKRGAKLGVLYIGDDGGAPEFDMQGFSNHSQDAGDFCISRNLHLLLQSVGNDPRTTFPGTIAFMPVSPWDLASVERVSRLLRYFLDSTRYKKYPVEIAWEQDMVDLFNLNGIKWIQKKEGKNIILSKLPSDSDWQLFNPGKVIEKLQKEYDDALLKHEDLKVKSSGEKKGAFNRQKNEANMDRDKKEKILIKAKYFLNKLEKALEMPRSFLICPVCRAQNPEYVFEARAGGCFRCDCLQCNTRWETRLCVNRHRFAVILPGGKFIDTEDKEAGWEDRIYGCDILSLPVQHANGEWGIICPECGEITGSERGR